MVFPLTRRMSRIKIRIRDRFHEIKFADGRKRTFWFFLLFYKNVTKTQEGLFRHSVAEVRRPGARLGASADPTKERGAGPRAQLFLFLTAVFI